MTDPRNPYSPPSAHVADQAERPDPSDETFVPNGRSLPAGRGAGWIGDAWRLLKAQPGKWAVSMLLLLVFYIVISIIPLVNIFSSFVGPFVTAGIAMAADEQRRKGTFEIGTLLGGFNRNPVSLLAVAGVIILMFIVIAMVIMFTIGGSVATQLFLGKQSEAAAALLAPGYLLMILVCLALALPVIAATYLAPALIVLHDQPAIEAMKMSLVGVFKNILPGIVFGLCALGLTIVASIPLGLGLLIVIPLMIITNYTVYRDIFIEENS
jgi:uncharacterized membrane protein